MDMEEQLRKLKESLVDLDAAFSVSVLSHEQKDREKVFINLLGPLKRRWSTDIDSANVDTFENGEDFISLNINRSGIYDSLPESVFHDFPKLKSDSGKEMAKVSRRQKLVEKDARLFFKPAENEIFNQRVQLSSIENHLFNELFSHFLNKESHDFWLTAVEVPGKYLTKFNGLLPFVHKTVGDLELTAKCLEYIIEENIKIEISNAPQFSNIDHEPSMSTMQLSDCLLGNDTILAPKNENDISTMNLTIGPIENTPLTEFMNNGEAKVLLDCFSDYYIPFEFEAEWNIILEKDSSYFILHDEDDNANSYLNYTTVI